MATADGVKLNGVGLSRTSATWAAVGLANARAVSITTTLSRPSSVTQACAPSGVIATRPGWAPVATGTVATTEFVGSVSARAVSITDTLSELVFATYAWA